MNEPSTAARDFAQLLGPLRRAVLKATRMSARLPDLSEPQIEVLRLLADRGPMAPNAIAATLQIAASTLSNLLKALTVGGLIQRVRRSDDQRRVQVAISAEAMHLLDIYDATSLTAIEDFLTHLPERDRATFEAAVPVLRAMLSTFAAASHEIHPSGNNDSAEQMSAE